MSGNSHRWQSAPLQTRYGAGPVVRFRWRRVVRSTDVAQCGAMTGKLDLQGVWREIPEEVRFAAEQFDLLGGDIEPVEARAAFVLENYAAIDMSASDAANKLLNVMRVLGSNARPQFLERIADELPDTTLHAVLPSIHAGWNLALGARPMIDFDDWRELWIRVAFCSDGPPPPQETVVLYRGGTEEEGLWIDWTDDLAVARKFARDFTSPRLTPVIFEAEVDPVLVLGRVDGRGESEYIVDDVSLVDNVVDVKMHTLAAFE